MHEETEQAELSSIGEVMLDALAGEFRRLPKDRVLQVCADWIAAGAQQAMTLHPSPPSARESYAAIRRELDGFCDLAGGNPGALSERQRAIRQENMRRSLMRCATICLWSMVDLEVAGREL